MLSALQTCAQLKVVKLIPAAHYSEVCTTPASPEWASRILILLCRLTPAHVYTRAGTWDNYLRRLYYLRTYLVVSSQNTLPPSKAFSSFKPKLTHLILEKACPTSSIKINIFIFWTPMVHCLYFVYLVFRSFGFMVHLKVYTSHSLLNGKFPVSCFSQASYPLPPNARDRRHSTYMFIEPNS